jgi:uncharacterized protein DUF6463
LKARSSLPGNGLLLRLLALAHLVVGAGFYRRELRSIGRDGIVAGVPYRGPKATAFWFLVPSAAIWQAGSLMSRAEDADDARALRNASGIGAVSAGIAIVCLPVSGFWVWLAISARGLRQAREMRSD